jgi:hypothetical protein
MKGMTFKQLKEEIEKFNDEQLNSTVTTYIPWEDEYFGILEVTFATKDNDVLDAEHPVLFIFADESGKLPLSLAEEPCELGWCSIHQCYH